MNKGGMALENNSEAGLGLSADEPYFLLKSRAGAGASNCLLTGGVAALCLISFQPRKLTEEEAGNPESKDCT